MTWHEWVGIGLALAGLVLAILQWWPRHQRFAWILRRHEPVADVGPWTDADLELRFQGQRIPRASSLVLRIQNLGRRAIRPGDQLRPPSFGFDETNSPANVFLARTVGTRDGFEPPDPEVRRANVRLPPTVWRAGDWLDLEILHDGTTDVVPLADAALVDGKPIRRLVPRERKLAWLQVGATAYLFASAAWLFYFTRGATGEEITWLAAAPFGLLIAAIAILAAWNSDPIRILRGLEPMPGQDSRRRPKS